ncbi:MAG: hypothetical protein Q7U06_00235, partial [Pseudomonadota bacterium]|nr:hypothetical protein [Pseudomonadota bacterium]
ISVLATGVEDWAEGEMNGVWDDPLVVGNPATHSEGGSSHGSETIEIGAPGFIYTDGSAYMPSLGHGMLGNWFQYERDTKSATGATSAAAGVVGGAAGLALAACPSSFSSGAELAQHILDSANQAPTVSLADFVIDGRYLDVEATVDCP